MSSFLDLDIAEFVRNDNGELSLAYVSIIMCMIANMSLGLDIETDDLGSHDYH